MKIKSLSLLALIIPACHLNVIYPWHVFCDPANFLIEVDVLSFFKDEIGIYSGITYTLFGGSPTKLKEKIFASLDQLGAQTCAPELMVRDPEGHVLPQLLCDFLSDKIDVEDTRKKAVSHLHKSHKKGKERDIMENITTAVFDPKKLAYHTKTVNKGLALVEEIRKKHGEDNVFILANFNKDTILKLLAEKDMQPLAALFPRKNIFVSGMMKELLPSKGCFERVLKLRNLAPDQCLFITSMPFHAQSAREIGMKVILVQNGDLKKVHHEVKALGII